MERRRVFQARYAFGKVSSVPMARNTPRLFIPTAHALHLVHNNAHFTYRVLMPDIAYDLDFIILASPDNCQWSRYQRDLVVNTTLYSLL